MQQVIDFDEWRADCARREAEMKERIKNALASNVPVLETLPSGKEIEWFLGKPTFLAPYRDDPEYLAKHVTSRHFGFGWPITIGGTTFRMGRVS